MGCNLPEDIYFDNIQDVQNWFRKGSGDANSAKLKRCLIKNYSPPQSKRIFHKKMHSKFYHTSQTICRCFE